MYADTNIGNGYLLVHDDYTGPSAKLKLPIDDGSTGLNNAQGSTLLVLPSKRHTKRKSTFKFLQSQSKPSAVAYWKQALQIKGTEEYAKPSFDFTPLYNAIAKTPVADDIAKLNMLRTHAGAPENTLAGIDKLLEYYRYLEQIEPFFGNLESVSELIQFSWYDAIFKDRPVVETCCIQYEKAAVLMNVASVFSHLASTERQFGENGLKTSAAYFLKAAGVVLHIRESLIPRFEIKLEKCADLTNHSTTACIYAMIAQAHECYHERASLDQSSSRIVSMIAAQTGDYYDLALRHSQHGANVFTSRFPTYWIMQLKAKSLFFHSVAHFHAPTVLPEIHAVGERITRLALAKNLASKALSKARHVQGRLALLAKANLDNIAAALLLADTANFQEYQQTIVDARLLAPLDRPKQSLAVPVPFESILNSSSGKAFKPLSVPNAPVAAKPKPATENPTALSAFLASDIDDILDTNSSEKTLAEFQSDCDNMLEQLLRLDGNLRNASSCFDPQKLKLAISKAKKAAAITETVRLDCSLFPIVEMTHACEKMHQMAEKNANMCLWVLDHIDPTQFSAAPAVFALVGPLRTACRLLETKSKARAASTANLKNAAAEEDSAFDANNWSSGNLEMVLPFSNQQTQTQASNTLKEMKTALQEIGLLEKKVREHILKVTQLFACGKASEQQSELDNELSFLKSELDDLKTRSAMICEFCSDFGDTDEMGGMFLEAVEKTSKLQTALADELFSAIELRKQAATLLSLCLQLPLTTFLNTGSIDPYVLHVNDSPSGDKQISDLIDKLGEMSGSKFSGNIKQLYSLYKSMLASNIPQPNAGAQNSKTDLRSAWTEMKARLSKLIVSKEEKEEEIIPVKQNWEPELDRMGKIATTTLQQRHDALNKPGANWVKVLPTSRESVERPQRPNTSLGLSSTEKTRATKRPVSGASPRAASPALSSRPDSPASLYIESKVDEIMRENDRLRSLLESKSETVNLATRPSRAPSPLRGMLGNVKIEERQDSALDDANFYKSLIGRI